MKRYVIEKSNSLNSNLNTNLEKAIFFSSNLSIFNKAKRCVIKLNHCNIRFFLTTLLNTTRPHKMGNVLLTFPILIVYIAGAFLKVLNEAPAFLVSSDLTFPSLHLKSPTFLIRLTFLPSSFSRVSWVGWKLNWCLGGGGGWLWA